jgi:hypothetical protein
MVMTDGELEQAKPASEDRNVMVVWRGDTVMLCVGEQADDAVTTELQATLVACGVDPSMIVVARGGCPERGYSAA